MELPQLLPQSELASKLPTESLFPLPLAEISKRFGDALNNDIPTEILNPSRRENRRLGRYFEQLLFQALKVFYPSASVSQGVVLPKSGPAGELDFLLSFPDQTLIHLEVAFKFFLYVPSETPSIKDFFGPQLRDRLDLKLQKILSEQLLRPIPSELQSLQSRLHRALWLSGMLFYPRDSDSVSTLPCFEDLGLNPAHKKGWWMRQSYCVKQSSSFYVLSKPWWGFPFETAKDVQELKTLQVLKKITVDHALAEPEFCLQANSEDVPESVGFIVPDAWGP